jgi:HEAT repeat protein
MSQCATCGKPVDALRARHTRVEGARINVFCSPECMAGAPAAATASAPLAPRHSAAVAAVMPEVSIPRRSASGAAVGADLVSAPVPVVARPARPSAPPPVAEPAAPTPAASAGSGGVVAVDEQTMGVGPALTMPVVSVEQLGSRSHPVAAVPPAAALDPTLTDVGRDPTELAPRPAAGEPGGVRPGAPPRRRLMMLAVGGVGLLAAIAIGVRACRGKPGAGASRATSVGAAGSSSGSALGGAIQAPAVIAPIAPLDVGATKTRATDILSGHLGADGDRIRALAASALARTQEPRALDMLGKLLDTESTPSVRIAIAYALARGGDARGKARLQADAKSDQREVRVDAGRRLVMLGDETGRTVMTRYLDVADRRLSAAEALATMGDQGAIAILQGIRADAKAEPDTVRRATIALGRAGQADVAPALRELLTDFHFRNAAAVALAALGDPAARPVLAEQLRIEGLCVEAALALRRLDSTLDPAPLLPALVDIMNADKDTTQIAGAEATLILTGPAAIAEFD